MVYSPIDAVAFAREHGDRQVVFFAVGFETTAPATAMAVAHAASLGLENFSILASHVPGAAGHRAVLGLAGEPRPGLFGRRARLHDHGAWSPTGQLRTAFAYRSSLPALSRSNILQGVLICLRQLEHGRHEVENQYARSVRPAGNPQAVALIDEVFEVVPRKWRGIGEIAASGLGLRAKYGTFDAARRFPVSHITAQEPAECIAGQVLQGHKKPHECPAFRLRCTPEHPLGAPMVSSEGACAAYFRYRRNRD